VPQSLQAKIDGLPNLLDHFRNLSGGNSPSAFPVVPAEFSNWRDEQKAWLESVVLLDQTHHMYYEYMRGKDILKLLTKVAANSFRSFEVDRGKQIVCCSPDGHLIGDGILFHLAEEEVMCVGRAIVPNWLRYNAEVEGYDIEFRREARSPSLSMGREVRRSVYRYQIQGPRAADLITKLNGGKPVDLKFFHMGHLTIAGRAVRALRHGMAGVPGLEIWGPFDDWEAVRNAVLEAGEEFGIVPVGNKGYSSATFGSGWISSALPAIYTGEAMRPYREWLGADSYEANSPLGGSFVSDRIEDYYVTPFELGYGHIVKFDHDFIGREALEKMDPSTQRRKVTFEWDGEDVGRIFLSYFQTEKLPYKWIELPRSDYTAHDYDSVMLHGRPAGLSMLTGYDFNYRAMLSLGIVGSEVAVGDEVSIVWGEPGGGTAKPAVERHRQIEIRARVREVPYAHTTDRRIAA
jgi:vanillate/3-O-methylgallate O-demethylase